jgi:hypothetical protein
MNRSGVYLNPSSSPGTVCDGGGLDVRHANAFSLPRGPMAARSRDPPDSTPFHPSPHYNSYGEGGGMTRAFRVAAAIWVMSAIPTLGFAQVDCDSGLFSSAVRTFHRAAGIIREVGMHSRLGIS